MKKTILMSVGLSTLLLSSPVLAKTNHLSLNVTPITGDQSSVNGKTAKLASIKVLHNKTLLGKGTASKNGTFKVSLKTPIKNGWKYTVQAAKKGFATKKYTVTALYSSTKTSQTPSDNYQDEIQDLQNTIASLQSQLNDLKNKTQQTTTTIITEPSNNTNDDSNDNNSSDNPIPTANQKKIKELQDQIQAIDKQRSAINQNISQVETSINKSDPNENEDIPSSEKLDEYNTGESIDQLKESLSYYTNNLATDTEKLNKLNPNDDEYYVVASKIKNDNNGIKGINGEISYYNSMTKTIAGFGGQAGYLKKAQEYLDQYNALKSKLSDLTKQGNDLNNQINSLEAQIDTLENQQD